MGARLFRMLREKQSDGRRNFFRDRSGASAIEFALIAPILFFCLLSIIELGVIALVSSGLDNAVFSVARMIRTGRSDAPADATTFENMVCTRLGGNQTDCHSRLVISVEKFARFTDANSFATTPPNGSFNKGVAGDIIVVKANYTWPMVSPLLAQGYQHDGPFEITISSRAAFKNEPF
jgi:Flp pilus assembly protein TadG